MKEAYGPTYVPSYESTYEPTYHPTYGPTYEPTYEPTKNPTQYPTNIFQAIPKPGQRHKINNISNDSITVNETVSLISETNIIHQCVMNINNTDGDLLNSSYILVPVKYTYLVYNRTFLVSTSKIYHQLPTNCSSFPALKIISRTNYTIQNQTFIKLYVIEAKFTEYFSQMNVNLSNISLKHVNSKPFTLNQTNNLHNMQTKYNLTHLASNTSNVNCGCVTNGTQCINLYGGSYGNQFGATNSLNIHNNSANVNNKCFPQQNNSRNDYIRRNMLDDTWRVGLSIDANTKLKISGQAQASAQKEINNHTSLNGNVTQTVGFSIESGLDFFAGFFVNFVCDFDWFTLREFRFVFGYETYFNSYINIDATEGINLDALVAYESKRVWFDIVFIPVVITFYVQLDVGVQAYFGQELSATLGYNRIYHEWGVQYVNRKWQTMNNKNYSLVWYHTFGGNFMSNKKDSNSSKTDECLEIEIVPYVELTIGCKLYDLLDISLANKVPLSMLFRWPDSCDEVVTQETQLKLSLTISYQLSLGIGIDILGWKSSWSVPIIKNLILHRFDDTCFNFDIPFLNEDCGQKYHLLTMPPSSSPPECYWEGTAPDCDASKCYWYEPYYDFPYPTTPVIMTSNCGDGDHCTSGHKICCCMGGIILKQQMKCREMFHKSNGYRDEHYCYLLEAPIPPPPANPTCLWFDTAPDCNSDSGCAWEDTDSDTDETTTIAYSNCGNGASCNIGRKVCCCLEEGYFTLEEQWQQCYDIFWNANCLGDYTLEAQWQQCYDIFWNANCLGDYTLEAQWQQCYDIFWNANCLGDYTLEAQ
eukprot:442606_1